MSEESPATLEVLREMLADLARSTAVGFEAMGRRFDAVEARLDRIAHPLDRAKQTGSGLQIGFRELKIAIQGLSRKVAEHDEEIDLLKARVGAGG